MKFMLIGVNHKTAPVEVRERFAIAESKLPEAMQRLAQYPGVEEGLIVSTCNRVEFLARTRNGSADLHGFLRDLLATDIAPLRQHLYEKEGDDAVRHLFRVAASLDSMVVGEPQVLGQVKEAYAVARAVGAVHSQLDALVTRAFNVAKRVRTETAIGGAAVSVASVAVELAQKIFGSLDGKTVLLVGAGKMSELAARHLVRHGANRILVTNRTNDRAVEFAARFDGEVIDFTRIYEDADRADIIITSTGAPVAIFRPEHAERFMARRKNRPMFFIDIAVPRDVDAAVNRLDGVFVYDIDDLQQVAASHAADRSREAQKAEQIIETEVERFRSRIESRDVVPTILSLQEHLENIRTAEIDRVRGRLGRLSPEQELAIDAATRAMINKIMHTPITTLKTAARDPEANTLIALVRRLFNLRESAPQFDDAADDAAGKQHGAGRNT